MPRSSLRKHLKLKPSKLAEKRRKAFYFKIGLYFVFFITLIVGISSLSHARFMTIDKVDIKGLEFLKQDQISEIISQQTNGKILWLFPKTNIFLYPKEEIRNEIYKKHKRVFKAEISLDHFSDLNISIEERKPFGIWCSRQEECFFLDNAGFIFDQAPASTTPTLVLHRGDVKSPPIGKYFLSKDKFKELYEFINLISSNLKSKPLEVKKYDSTIEILFDTNTIIKISTDDSLENVFENLVTLIGYQTFSSNGDSKLDPFKSIDLRFGQKVFYKLK